MSPAPSESIDKDAQVDDRLAATYDALASRVTGYFRARGARDPDDLCGDVFVKVAERLGTFKGDDRALRRWVFTIAHNRLVDEYRSAPRHREETVAEPPHGAVRTDDVSSSSMVDPALIEALGRLTDEQRDVIVLRYVADLPVRDVAKVVGKRTGAVKMLQARGLEDLRRTLATEGGAARSADVDSD